MSKKSWPILYSNLLYKMGQDFLDMQYWTVQAYPIFDEMEHLEWGKY